MDTFVLAATSFIISLSLMITGKKDKLQASFSGFCGAVFISQIAIFLRSYFNFGFLLNIEYLGILAIAPFSLQFFRNLTRNKSFLSSRPIIVFTSISITGAVAIFTPMSQWAYFYTVILYYSFFSLGLCYIALTWHVNKLSPGTEKKRLGYLLFACPIALIIGNINQLNYWGFDFPVITGIMLSVLLYFILLIIAYPQLRELHDFFARWLVIFVNTLAGAAILYLAFLFSGRSPLSFAGLLMASFLIVISFSPIKMILKKIFSYFYPESKDVFTSLYEFDEKLEKEKTLMLAEMAPVFAHEIRNPLGSIKGAAQYLKSEASTEEQKELFNVIVEGTDRLNNVVSQFLDYARPYKLNLRVQNINAIIQKAVSIIAANRLAEKITIVQELDKNLPEVNVDEQQFVQVIINIALNAIESMPRGGNLTFRTSNIENSAGGTISITIRDTGIGISKKEIKDIFKPFFTTKERGVGLGLAICQKIIKEHGGYIRVKSIPTQGTVFVIKLKKAEDN
ncbi:MAG: ATP-binding protein [Deltaproteobacteria bacterium]|nr:ATP-binding protein [Deltaproteobacteria bacterium]